MTLASELTGRAVRSAEKAERELTRIQWDALMNGEADNFEFDRRLAAGGIDAETALLLASIECAQVVA